MLLYVLKENKNEKMPEALGKWYAYAVTTQTIDVDGLAGHMASHNTPFSKGAIKGMITDMTSCIKELCLQGIAVKIDDLAIFSIGIKNKEGANSEREFNTQKNIEGYKLRARGTGDFSAANLDVDLKKISSLLANEVQIPTDDKDDPGDDSGDSPETPGNGGGSDNSDAGGGSGSDETGGGGSTGDGGGDVGL